MYKSNMVGIIFIIGIIAFVLVASYGWAAVFPLAEAQESNPHPHEGEGYLESECYTCHLRGLTRAPVYDTSKPYHPATGGGDASCLDCHSQTEALYVPHALDGPYENCNTCHADGAMFSIELPHGLDGIYENCADCHDMVVQ